MCLNIYAMLAFKCLFLCWICGGCNYLLVIDCLFDNVKREKISSNVLLIKIYWIWLSQKDENSLLEFAEVAICLLLSCLTTFHMSLDLCLMISCWILNLWMFHHYSYLSFAGFCMEHWMSVYHHQKGGICWFWFWW